MTKQEYREIMLAQRREQDAGDARAASVTAQDRLLGLPEFEAANSVCSYLSMPQEMETGRILNACRDSGKQLFVLALCGDTGVYWPVEHVVGEALERGRFGVPEPVDKRWADMVSMDLVVVPGLAFDVSGNRVGWGLGYYDRLLSVTDPERPAVTVGFAFDFQVVEKVPAAEHDVPLDLVITEKRIVRCSSVAGSRIEQGE